MCFLDGLDAGPTQIRALCPNDGLQNSAITVRLQQLALLAKPANIVLNGVARPLSCLIGQLVRWQPLQPRTHRVAIVRLRGGASPWGNGGRADDSRWRRVFFGGDLHITASHRGHAEDAWAIHKVAQECGAEVSTSMKTG